MYEWRRGAAVVPGVPDDAGGARQDAGWVHSAGGQLVAQLVAVVGQVPDLEHEGDAVKGEKDHARADHAHEDVELEVGLAAVGPRQGDVDQEAGDALVDDEGLTKNTQIINC